MHELGLTQEIVAIVSEQAGQRRVQRIVLEIGKLSCILPDAIRFCFDACTEGTVAEGAVLEIIEKAGRGSCRQCGAELAMEKPLTVCSCGSGDVEWLSGDELTIQAVELG